MNVRDNQSDDNFTMSDPDDQAASIDPQEEAYLRGRTSEPGRSSKLRLAIIGAVVLVLILITISIFRGGEGDSAGKIQELEARIAQIEEKIAKMDWIEKSVTRIGAQEQNFGMLSERVERFEASVKKELSEVSQQLKALRQKPAASSTAKPAAVSSSASTPKVAAPKTHTVQAGETLFGISRNYGLTVEQLRSLNRLSDSDTIQPGQKLVVAPATKQ
jgi:LysM repeat protein